MHLHGIDLAKRKANKLSVKLLNKGNKWSSIRITRIGFAVDSEVMPEDGIFEEVH